MADKHLKPSPGDPDAPALEAFIRGYLHQDFHKEYETPAAALAAYCREASRHEIVALERDLARFLEKTADLPFANAKALFIRELHSGWSPPNRAALTNLLEKTQTELNKK